MSTVSNESMTVGSPLAHESEDQKLQLKINELIDKVLTPPHLSRADMTKVQLQTASTDYEKLALLTVLFKTKVDAAKQAGLSPQACIEEFRQAASQKMFLTGENSDLKNELAVLQMGINDTGNKIYLKRDISSCIDLLNLKAETGVSFDINSKDALITCAEPYAKIFKHKIGDHKGEAWAFYETVTQPNFHKVLDYLEKEGDRERIQKVFNLYISCLTPEFDVWKSLFKGQCPIARALPYIAKYGSLDQVELLHQLRKWRSWEKAHHWIDLQCRAAEILASTDLAKAQQYIAKAEKDLKEKFVLSFWFTSGIDSRANAECREQATKRIEKAKLVL